MRKTKIKSLIFALPFGLAAFAPGKIHAQWRNLNQSVEYASLQCNDAKIMAVRFAPSAVTIKALVAKAPGTSAAELIKKTKATAVINSGYFSPDIAPIGLIVSERKKMNPAHNTSWWSIFMIKDYIPKIIMPSEWRKDSTADFAVQAGPRLLVNSQIPPLKKSVDRAPRSAVCIDKAGRIILASSPSPDLLLFDWAKCLGLPAPVGVECVHAMNLDGGSSTQMSVHGKGVKIDEPGLAMVPSFIAVWPKDAKR